jgi:hypothetical protein
LLSRQHQPQPRGDDRERITRARQAAEALFTETASHPAVGCEILDAGRPAVGAKPRVLGVTPPTAPVAQQAVAAPVSPEPPATHEIPRSEFARIRALVKYGMKVAEVAEVYAAAVGDIERIIRQA